MSGAINGLLGLAMRAGKLLSGEQAATQAVRKGEAALVLVDEAASDNTRKYARDACAYYHLPLFELPAGLLGQAIGKPNRKLAALTDPAMARKLIGMLETNLDSAGVHIGNGEN